MVNKAHEFSNITGTPHGSSVCVYTAVTGKFDSWLTPLSNDGLTFLRFTDLASPLRHDCWRPMDLPAKDMPDIFKNRWCKFHPHEILKQFDISIYIDGNIKVIGNLAPLLNSFAESGSPIGLFPHRDRSCIEEEIEACKRFGKFDDSDLRKAETQHTLYVRKYPSSELRLTDNAIIFRRHNNPRLIAAMKTWWQHLSTYTKRDQISLGYVLKDAGIEPHYWNWNFRTRNPYFTAYGHYSKLSIQHKVKQRLSELRHVGRNLLERGISW